MSPTQRRALAAITAGRAPVVAMTRADLIQPQIYGIDFNDTLGRQVWRAVRGLFKKDMKD